MAKYQTNSLDAYLAVTKALADETRVRALLALREEELCLCQLIALLELAPSTVSKHLDLLYRAGLVQRRKQGRWHYFRLADDRDNELVRKALRWTVRALEETRTAKADAKQLRTLRSQPLDDVSACYRCD